MPSKRNSKKIIKKVSDKPLTKKELKYLYAYARRLIDKHSDDNSDDEF